MSHIHTTCPYCGVGCGIIASSDDQGALSLRGDPAHPANFGRLCSKGAALGETLGFEGRLLHPEVDGERVDWSSALDAVANGFRRTIDAHGPDAVAFYLSGQLLTEDYYVANKLMKGFIGSANIDTNSRLCMASAVAGYKRAFGADAVPCSYDDLERAKLIILVGSNAAWCHPVLFQRIARAREENPDLQVVVIDPRHTPTCEIADLHLQIRPGSDLALFNGLLAFLSESGELNESYIAAHTEGFDAALAAAQAMAPEIDSVAAQCDLAAATVQRFFRLFARTERVVTLYSQGVNQWSHGTDNNNAIINCHLATGRLARPGMGPFSLTGQPNAMGGREVGGLANQLAAHMEFSDGDCDCVQRFWNAPAIARKPGLKAVELFHAMETGKIKAVWIMGTNPAVSLPHSASVRRALEKCELVVVSDVTAETDTLRHAHIKLPALAWGEKEGSVTNSERRISRQRAFLPVPGEARADWWILAEVGKRLGHTQAFSYGCPAEIFGEHAALSAFENDHTRAFTIGALANLEKHQYDSLAPVQWPITEDRPQDTTRLFKPFATTKSGGFGVGLYQCKTIVESHGGRVVAESREGQGSILSFSIPAMKDGE
jgi:assimilatory nitrate reductase catalytic subunit